MKFRKILLAAGFLAVFQTSHAATVEEAIVELRITRKEFSAVENRYKKKVENMMGKSVCSGSFITDNGDIITAGHCVQDAAQIDVITFDNRTYEAVVVATSGVHDLALIHIDRRNTAYFRPAEFVERGEKIFILGSPLGISNSLTTGIIAKLDGDVTLVDCGALPGNSGSAVYNETGQMVGVLTAGYIVGFGTTHLNVAQSIDAIWFFLVKSFSKGR